MLGFSSGFLGLRARTSLRPAKAMISPLVNASSEKSSMVQLPVARAVAAHDEVRDQREHAPSVKKKPHQERGNPTARHRP